MNSWLPSGFSELERLGDGSFGRVELIQREEDGSLFALKVLEKQGGIESADVEIESLNSIDSPFVAHLYEVFRNPKSVSLMIDPALGGSLRQMIAEHREKGKPIPTDTIYSIFAQVLLALRDVHKQKIVHRDLGPANILFVYQDKSKELRILLVDFGVSASLKGKPFLKGSVGTPSYMSPELAKADLHNEKTDVYSLGVILYEMCELQLPMKKKGHKHYEFKYHDEFSNVINKMLNEDQNQRPSISDVLSVPEIANYAKKYENSQRIKLTAHDWNPVVIEFNDIDIDIDLNFEDLPPIDSTIPSGSGRLLQSTPEDVSNALFEAKLRNEQILAERHEEQIRINNEIKRQERQAQQKWKEQKEDLSQHKNDYFQRLEQIKSQKRDKRINSGQMNGQKQKMLKTKMPSIDLNNDNYGEEDRAADDLERIRFVLEKQIGAEKLIEAHRKLEKNMMLSPAELQISPKEFDAISRLIRKEREVFGSV